MTEDHLYIRASLICESPIEGLMRDALLWLGCGKHRPFTNVVVPGSVTDITRRGDTVWVIPQAVILKYRIDLLIFLEFRGPILVAVECDGHEWHERTHQQAQRDKSRDRVLQSMGLQVLRFTGREIVNDACKCAFEVAKAINSELWRRIDAHHGVPAAVLKEFGLSGEVP